VGSGLGAGTITLNGALLSFSGVSKFSYKGGSGDTISVTPFANSQLPWNVAVTVAGAASALGGNASLTYNSVNSPADTLTATGPYAGTIVSPGLAAVQFSNVNVITANASQSPGAQLTVNLPSKAATDMANLLSVGQGTADIQFVGLFSLNVDTADYTGLTINGNNVGKNNLSLVTSTGAGLSIPLTLNYYEFQSVSNTGTTSIVNATESGDTIAVTSAGLVTVTDLVGNLSEFNVADLQLVLNGLGNSDTINIPGNHPFTNGIYVYGNASYTDVINYTATSGAGVTVTPSVCSISQTGAGAVVYAGINRVNLTAGGATSTLTVAGSIASSLAGAEDFDFTPTAAGAGSFTDAGPGAPVSSTPLFYTGVGKGITISGAAGGLDQLGLTCPSGNKTIDTEQTAAGTLTYAVVNAFTVPFSLTSIGSVNISDTAGTAVFQVGVAAALETTPAASLNFQVVGSPIYNDQLLVMDEGGAPPGDQDVISPSGAGSGSVTVGALHPVTYQDIQNVKIDAPAYSDTLDGHGNLTIMQETAGDNDNLSLALSGGNYTLTDSGGLTFAIPTGDWAGFISGGSTDSITIPSADVQSISVQLGSGTNVFHFTGSGGAAMAPITVNTGSTSGDQVNINGAVLDSGTVSLTSGGSISQTLSAPITATTLNVSAATGITLNSANVLSNFSATDSTSGDIDLNDARALNITGITQSGNGNVNVSSSAAITISGATTMVSTVGGNLTLTANSGGAAGNFSGITVSGATIESVTGTASLTGTGGTAAGSGVAIMGGGKVETTGAGGAVSVVGYGGGSVGAAQQNYGVILNGGTVTSIGSGNVTVKGFGGGSSGNYDIGVSVNGGGSITSSGGIVSVVGTGGGTGASSANYGTEIANGTIAAGGSGTVTVQGTGGTGSGGNNYGVAVDSSAATVTSAGGNVSVIGNGGGGPSGTAILISGGSVTGVGSGLVTLDAVGGGAGAIVDITGAGTAVTAAAGGLDIIAAYANATNGQFQLTSSAKVQTSSTGAITISANSVSLDNTVTINAGSNTVTMAPTTAGTTINVGGTTNTLQLSTTVLGDITAGTLVLGNTSSGILTVGANVTFPAATNLQLISGSNIVLSGGQVNTRGGTLQLSPGTPPAAVEPTAVGTDASASTVSFGAGSDLSLNIAGTAAGTQYNQLNVAGTLNLTGATLVLTGNYQPLPGNTFTIVSATSVTGTFANLPASGSTITFNGVQLAVTYTATTVILSTVVRALPVSQLVVSNVSPATVTAGGAVTLTLTAEDSTANVVPTYTGTVQLTSTDGHALLGTNGLPASYAFVPADNGAHTFTVVLQTAGTQMITATDQVNGLTATSSAITVTAGAFSKFLVSVPGGNAFAAGNPFLVTVQAGDQFGNPVTNYSGPTSVTVAASPPDPQFSSPFTDTLNSSGFGFFLANLKTAGSYTLTATAGSLSGTSTPITVIPSDANYLTVTAPSTTTTDTAFNATVKAFDHFGNLATGYSGQVHITSSDGSALLPASSTLTNGVGTFSVKLRTAGSQTITATDTAATNPAIVGTSSAITTRGLTVTGFTPSATGFTISFSKPMIASGVYLYGGTVANPIQDVTLIGKNTASTFGPVNGTLVIDPSGTGATFKASIDWLQNIAGSPTSVLPNDTWTVTLQSGTGTGSSANGFFDVLGAPLDGADDASHANYVTTFATSNDGQPTLTMPDFARGPDSSSTIKLPNNSPGKGIPVTLANAPAGTTDMAFTLSYNPALLTPIGADTTDSSGAGSAFTMGTPSNGTVTFTWHNSAGLSGNIILGDILANVPNSAANQYGAKELLRLSSITLNGAPFTGVTGPAVHINAYFGDLSGDGQITGLDLATAGNLAAGAPTSPLGLSVYKRVDPGLIGDIGGDGSIDSAAISSLASYLAHVTTSAIPTPPAGLTIAPGGPDPVLSLAIGQSSGGIVNVPVLLDHARPAGSTGMTEAIIGLTYDPRALTVTPADITLGSIPAAGSGWKVQSVVDAATGQIAIDLYSTTPITQSLGGSLVNIAFHLTPGVTVPATAVQLVNAVTPQGHWFSTEVADGQSKFVLSPGVDQLMIQTGAAVALPSTVVGATIAADQAHVANNPSKVEESSLLVDSEANDALSLMSNGGLAEETLQAVPANLVVAGALAFQPNASNPLLGVQTAPTLDIGTLPSLNAMLYRNSPVRIAVDRLFGSEVWAEDAGIRSPQANFWENANWHNESGSAAFRWIGTEVDCSDTIVGQSHTDEVASERMAITELVFGDMDS
jgi:hypothetical protein